MDSEEKVPPINGRCQVYILQGNLFCGVSAEKIKKTGFRLKDCRNDKQRVLIDIGKVIIPHP